MGETSAATAREVEATRKQMEDKVAKLSERAPEEARKLLKRVAFAVITAVAVLATRKLIDKLWERATGELPPTKVDATTTSDAWCRERAPVTAGALLLSEDFIRRRLHPTMNSVVAEVPPACGPWR